MDSWQDTFQDWARAWAAVQDLESTAEGAAVLMGGRRVAVWPGEAAVPVDGAELVLVTEDAAGAVGYAQSLGLRTTDRALLLRAATEDLDLNPDLPADAYLADAPMENYDLVELALFDRPVGSGRLAMGAGLAVISRLAVDDGHEEQLARFEHAMVAGLGDEAFAHGADVIYLVAGEAQAQRFAAVDGWSQLAEVLTFAR
ncbi:hypothetical protein JOF48_001003 [Arthrobacter stackebrandtii]|uniref:GNAT family N-acetyltransferase n=1 Tax=Arthrobacter stackebrandtii TaxID=272161 RepID=A0ABS4YTW9_9MICC|nr:hypothetical protein [Arthrobacter stackebrandtii]MBP2412204.1 hypothetical protein [Arthrobacter stackebrandtii]PYH01991.1 hypothetical protein CVV67_00670 [Arthrobacter stackebrandtii]